MSMKHVLAAAVAGGVLAAGGAAHAVSVVGAASITVKSALPDYLQVSELLAFNFGGTNVALAANGGVATALSQYDAGQAPQSGPAETNDGFFPTDYDYTFNPAVPGVYHSAGASAAEYLTITFAAPATLSRVSIYGRGDCCEVRDIYDVTIRNAAGGVIHTFRLDANNADNFATVTFDAPPPGGVPEPASWAMMIFGFGTAGSLLRRRRGAVRA